MKAKSARAIVVKDNQLLVMDRNKFGFKYLAPPGGKIEPGEQPEETVIREVYEETSIIVANPRLVIKEDAGSVFGRQYIYLCDYVSGQPKLHPSSIESLLTAKGQNLYKPKWLEISLLPDSNLLPVGLKTSLVKYLKSGFPDQPIELKITADQL